jgi:hypothetical protein
VIRPDSFDRLAFVALALAACACDGRRELAAASSVTVKLPPPRPLASAPGFTFQDAKKVRA